MRILFFGDSITQGFYDTHGGWAQRLANLYHADSFNHMLATPGYDTTEVFNLGVSGDTAQGILGRIESETSTRRWENDPVTIVLAVGINDSRKRDNKAIMDVYKFQETLEELFQKASEVADHVLIVGLSAVNESQTNPWPFSSGTSGWGNNRINLFEDTLKQCAEHAKLPFVPVHDEFLAHMKAGEQLLADGLHPNDAGHQFIAEIVKPELEKLLTQ